MQELRVGVIGLGCIGSEYAQMIYRGEISRLKLAAVANRGLEKRQWAKENLPGTKVFDNPKDLLASSLCDAILIATPHISHSAIAVAAFEAGCHVLCDKPAALDVQSARHMGSMAEKTGKAFGMMFNQRTNPLYSKVRQIIKGGEWGAIKRFSWTVTDWYRPQVYYDTPPWRAGTVAEGGGILLNQCPHQLDLLQWIFGMPKKLQAFCHVGKWHSGVKAEDEATVYMEFAHGTTGVFIASTGEAPGTNRLEIALDYGKLVCENGSLSLYRLEQNETLFRSNARGIYDVPSCKQWTVLEEDTGEGHAGILKSFTNHVLDKTPMLAEGREGERSLELSNAIHLSAWQGQAVQLPVDEQLFLKELSLH